CRIDSADVGQVRQRKIEAAEDRIQRVVALDGDLDLREAGQRRFGGGLRSVHRRAGIRRRLEGSYRNSGVVGAAGQLGTEVNAACDHDRAAGDLQAGQWRSSTGFRAVWALAHGRSTGSVGYIILMPRKLTEAAGAGNPEFPGRCRTARPDTRGPGIRYPLAPMSESKPPPELSGKHAAQL